MLVTFRFKARSGTRMSEHSLAGGKSRLATDLRVSSQEQSRVTMKERLMAAEIFRICDLTRRAGR